MLASQFRPILCLQLLLILIDIFINTFCHFFNARMISLLVMFVIQDIATVFCIIIIFLMFFNTYIFRAGMLNILFGYFRKSLVIASFYLILSIALHGWTLSVRFYDADVLWTRGYLSLYVIHRAWSAVYYYVIKRTTLRVVDPRFYQDGKWLRSKLAKQF